MVFSVALDICAFYLIKQRNWADKTTKKALKYNGVVQGKVEFFQTYFTNNTIYSNGESKRKCDYTLVKDIVVSNKYFVLYYEDFYYHFISLPNENISKEDRETIIGTITKQNKNVKLTKL